ncbi:hypothetical protein EJ04DRAFT_177078 [Polyplosphaeria fusca]|uniref:Uncharacterized protein n=1 Tax=Polyplosphaeria fusca TaxID=682080 RepID=A0A9P4R0V8_9PLEO|nr:hypothetical protein EJ04DRAFT_177078 [Polyplosphaeria fusca]
MPRLAHIASVLSFGAAVLAADIAPFAVQGGLDSCTPSDSTKYNSGGSISVNGFDIQVPSNLIAQFPATWVPFRDMCAAGVLGYEVAVTGNMVGNKAIAAQISLSQFLLQSSMGYIETVNFADGSLQIKGGPKVRINDPDGVYSVGNSKAKLFTADAENPSITAFSGFPMCIPRSSNDAKCPTNNRPSGTSTTVGDPLVMAPLMAGDFIEYSGIKIDGEILAYAITATSVQITTSASSDVPNYIRMEDAIIGIFDSNANVELADARFIGYLSSCNNARVSINAIDVDPCTGEESYRLIGTATPKPLTADARCKWEFRTNTQSQSTYTREYRITTNNDVIETKNGIQAGQYVQPVTEWIQPEVDVPGTVPPPFVFKDIRGLVQGDFLDGKQYGPLSPFPGDAPPAPSKSCSPDDIPGSTPTSTPSAAPSASVAPIANTQRTGAQVILSAANTAQGIPSSDLVFAWTQTSPSQPSVSITNPSQAKATIVAPSLDGNVTFQVKISLKSDTTKSSTANVTVKVSKSAKDEVFVDTYTWVNSQSGTITVNCHSNIVNGDSKTMSLWLNNGGSKLAMTAVSNQPGAYSYNSRSVKKPTNIQCVSGTEVGSGKSDLVTNTTSRRKRRGVLGAGISQDMSPAA